MRDHWWQLDTGEVMLLIYCAVVGGLWGMFALIGAVQYGARYPTLSPAGLLRAALLWPTWAALGIGAGLHTIGLISIEQGGWLIFSGTPFIGVLGGILASSFLIWRMRAPLL